MDMEINLKISFAKEDLSDQFWKADRRIQALIVFTALQMKKACNKDITVTSIFRTPEQQADLIKHGLPAVRNSAHLDGRAADIRMHSNDERKYAPLIEKIINGNFPRGDGFNVALTHGDGDNFHLHLQVPREKKF